MSNLLEQASLVMIPSGYAEDIVYSEIPLDGSGDLQFTRASNGTRINSAGLVEDVPWNLLANSQATWIGVSVTVTTGVTDPKGNTAGYTISAIGTGNETEYAYQAPSAFPISTGTVITYSIYMKGSGTIATYIERAISGTYFFDTKVHTLSSEYQVFTHSYTATTDAGGVTVYVGNSAGTTASSVTIAFPQVNYGSTAKPYFPTTDRLNVPRLTYQNGGGGCPSLLLEKQSTNLVTYSEQLDDASWLKLTNGSATTPVVTANYTTSPDGTQNADRVQFSRTGTTDGDYSLVASNQCNLNITGTATIYVKSLTSSTQNLLLYWGNGEGSVFQVTTEWTRITLSNLSAATQRILFGTRGGTGNYYNGGDLSLDVAVWGAQVEESSYPTSYIPTTSSSATRVADACYKTGISSLIGQTEGTIFLDVNFNLSNQQDDTRFVLSDGSTNNWIFVGYPDGGVNNKVRLYVSTTTTTVTFYSTNALMQGRNKIACGYQSGNFVIYLNGVLEATNSTAMTIPTCSNLTLEGSPYVNSTSEIVNLNQAALFPTRLTNAELASLTTI